MDAGQFQIEANPYHVKLKKTYAKIYELFPAFEETFVFLGSVGVGIDVLVHCNKAGAILFEHKFAHIVDSLVMVDTKSAIVLETRSNQITVFNLETHNFFGVAYQFMHEQSDMSTLFAFTNTKYICICENGNYNDNRLKLSYYSTPLLENSKPIHEYETDLQWNYQYQMRKGNQDSMLIWAKPRHDIEFQIRVYQIKDNKVGSFNCYKINNEIGLPYKVEEKLQVALINIWEAKLNVFCLVCSTQKSALGLLNAKGVVNNNFYWDISKNQMREAKFWFQQKYNDYLIDMFSIGKFAVFHTYFYNNAIVQTSPFYYVSNEEERIVSTGSWECTYRIKFTIPAYDSIFVQSVFENADVDEFKLITRKVVKKQKPK